MDNEYEVKDADVNMCECSVYAAYKVFGAKYMDEFIDKGAISAEKYITKENAEEFQKLNFKCMEIAE